jgi:hypothetical protein
MGYPKVAAASISAWHRTEDIHRRLQKRKK